MKIVIAPKEFIGDPEALAMMQAFYSRSKVGIEERLQETTLDMAKVREALRKYYIGYSHDSIGQCGAVTVFVENVSVLAAKAIQDHRLYNGQESSTRYIEFGSDFYTPNDDPEVLKLQQDWVAFYKKLLLQIKAALISRELKTCGDLGADEAAKLEKACQVKAFDIAAAFLPAGVLTNLSWTCSLAELNKRLAAMSVSPMREVRNIAQAIYDQAALRFPSAMKRSAAPAHADLESATPRTQVVRLQDITYMGVLGRSKYEPLPHHIHGAYFMQSVSTMDYRSFRDVQRHRTLNPSSPLLDPRLPMHSWYLSSLTKLGVNIDGMWELLQRVLDLDLEPSDLQYVTPLGIEVEFTQSGYLGDWLYYAELRTGETVHPTVRALAFSQWSRLVSQLPQILVDWLDPQVKRMADGQDLAISFKRAAQDIVRRDKAAQPT